MTELTENKIIDKNEFEHLIKLLDDEDQNIYSSVRERFISSGDQSVNFLKKYLNDENLLLRKRANEIISILKFEEIESRFTKLAWRKDDDILEDGIFLIASFVYPEIDMSIYRSKLTEMANEIQSRLGRINSDIMTIKPLAVLNTINNYLFTELGFKGNSEKFYDTDNSCINKVIDTKMGIPITLSIIYILISKKLGIPVFGINLPGHFIIKYSDKNEEFFIDPFNKGVTISKKDADEFIKKIGMSGEDIENIPYLKKTTEKEILLRVLRNLLEIYKEKNENIRYEQLEKLMMSLS